MPNWVYNGLTIEGNPEQVTNLIEQMNTPFVDYIESRGDLGFNVKQTKYVNPIFSFRNIIAPTDLEAYKAQPWNFENGEQTENEYSWYMFNNREWGTKWDVAVSEDEKHSNTYIEGPVQNGENLVVYYNFETAWAPPMPAMEKLSAQYPNLLLTLSYDEETGWGGEAEFLRGKMISDAQYGWKCPECDHKEEETPYCEECEYDMCPACGWGEPDDACQTHSVESELPPKVQVKEDA